MTRVWSLFVQDINNFLTQNLTQNLIEGNQVVQGGPGSAFNLDGPILFKTSTYVGRKLVGNAPPAVLTVPPDTCIVLEVFADAAASLAGIRNEYAVPADRFRLLFLVNGSAFTITLNHQDGAAAPAEQFSFPGSANYALAAGQVLGLLWHPTTPVL